MQKIAFALTFLFIESCGWRLQPCPQQMKSHITIGESPDWCPMAFHVQRHSGALRNGNRNKVDRRTFIAGMFAAYALLTEKEAAFAADVRCREDRCAIKDLLVSQRVPIKAREALQLANRLARDWNELTSACTGQTCKVTGKLVQTQYLNSEGLLITLATELALRDSSVFSLVATVDRDAFIRNAKRYEDSIKYAASCASLAKFDPEVPSFPKGSYVANDLKDDNGMLLGLNLENARDFLLDALDALVVVCSLLHYSRQEN